jgi:putative IMPACT (imprinted ancient) family translation regulator
VVVRYFGGVKLGTSGLINAYKTATKEALEQAQIIQKQVEKTFTINFDYLQTNKIMQLLKADGVKIKEQNYGEQCAITFTVRWSEADSLISNLSKFI